MLTGARFFLMEELVRYIVTSLVSKPEQVDIRRVDTEAGCTIEVRVAPEDMGKVIGKQGRIAKAIRTVVKAAAIHEDKRIVVEIVQ